MSVGRYELSTCRCVCQLVDVCYQTEKLIITSSEMCQLKTWHISLTGCQIFVKRWLAGSTFFSISCLESQLRTITYFHFPVGPFHNTKVSKCMQSRDGNIWEHFNNRSCGVSLILNTQHHFLFFLLELSISGT